MHQRAWSRTWPIAVLALALAVLVFWYTPAYLYSANTEQFTFPLLEVLPVLAIPVVATALVLTLMGIVLPQSLRRMFAALLASVFVFLLVRGFFLVPKYGLLDGVLNLPRFSLVGVLISAAIVLALTVVIVRTPLTTGRLAAVVGVVLVVQLVHMTVLAVTDPNPVQSFDAQSTEGLFEMGRSNLVVILLDALQSDVFEQVVHDRPELAKALDGFTYYPNTMSTAPTTFGSLPAIHSSNPRPPGMAMDQYFRRSITEQSFLTKLADAGWDTSLVNPIENVCPERIGLCFSYDASRKTSPRTRLFQESSSLVDLSLFRLAPPELKATAYNDGRFHVRSLFAVPGAQAGGDVTLREFASGLKRTSTPRTVKFIHVQSTHPPATRHADCSLLPRPIAPMTRPAALEVGTCALTRVVEIIHRMQRIGAYENTSMIVLADHGYNGVGTARTPDREWTNLIAHANPTLAVKPAGAKGRLRTDDAQMSLVDVGTIACALTKGCPVADPRWQTPDPNRTRFFMNYEWGDRFWFASTLKNEQHYEVRGPNFDPASWQRVDSRMLPEIDQLTFGDDDPVQYLGYGWGPVQGQGHDQSRWSIGRDASLNLSLPEDRRTRLTFRIGVLPEHTHQRIALHVNGRSIALIDVVGRDQISFTVPGSASTRDIDEIQLTFAQHQPRGDDADRRARYLKQLAVRFDDLRIDYLTPVPTGQETPVPPSPQ